jgi:pilus assembly protein CpaB
MVLGVALIAATVSSYGIYRAVANRPVRQVEVATSYTVVAAKAMPMGTRLTPDSVKLVAWLAKAPLAQGFSETKAVVDRGLVVAVAENEPLTESKLAPFGAGAGLPPSIPDGMRAISVKVDEVVGVAGFVVLAPASTCDDDDASENQGQGGRATRTRRRTCRSSPPAPAITEAVKKEGSKPIPSTVVTLLVSPDDAQRLALAQADGEVMLALRNPMDVSTPELRAIGTAGLMGASEAAAAAPAPVARKIAPKPVVVVVPPPPPPPKPYTVEAIRAAQRTEEVVR